MKFYRIYIDDHSEEWTEAYFRSKEKAEKALQMIKSEYSNTTWTVSMEELEFDDESFFKGGDE